MYHPASEVTTIGQPIQWRTVLDVDALTGTISEREHTPRAVAERATAELQLVFNHRHAEQLLLLLFLVAREVEPPVVDVRLLRLNLRLFLLWYWRRRRRDGGSLSLRRSEEAARRRPIHQLWRRLILSATDAVRRHTVR